MAMESTSQGGGNASSSSAASQPANAAGSGQNGAQSGAQGAASSHIDLSDDSLVRLPGAKEPVKWGDHYRGFQAEFTRSKQAQARLKQELDQVKAALQQREAAQRSTTAAQQPKPGADLLAKIKSLQYLSGEDAAGVVEHIMGQIDGVKNQDLARRDMALALIYKRLQAAEQALQHTTGRASQSDFETKISRWVADAGYDDDATQIAKEMYLAYEPTPELDEEFPRMFKERMEQLERASRKRLEAVREKKRQLPFVPGKGGNGAAGGPLADLKRADHRQVADKLWALVDGGSGSET